MDPRLRPTIARNIEYGYRGSAIIVAPGRCHCVRSVALIETRCLPSADDRG
jgi:hypothetical protein